MIKILLTIHLIISLLLIITILLQRTQADGLSGLSGGSAMGGLGVISARTASNFLSKFTIFLAIAFAVNALLLGNIAARNSSKTIIKEQPINQKPALPIAK